MSEFKAGDEVMVYDNDVRPAGKALTNREYVHKWLQGSVGPFIVKRDDVFGDSIVHIVNKDGSIRDSLCKDRLYKVKVAISSKAELERLYD